MNKKINIKINYYFIITFLIISIYLFYFYFNFDGTIIYGDGIDYYKYFIKIFIDGDLKSGEYTKFPIGTTLLQLPFLLFAYCCSRIYHINIENGYSFAFHLAVLSSAIFYCISGLVFLYKIVKFYFSDKIASLTCIVMMFGTLLPFYATKYASYSHIYGFFACTLFMYYVIIYEKNYNKMPEKRKNFDILLGILSGLAFLVRNMNIVIILTYIFYNVNNIKDFKERFKTIFSKKLIYQILPFLIILLIQIIVFSLQADKLVLYSYGDEKFVYIFNPKINEVLFSMAKGLFIFCPVLYLSFVSMFLFDNKNNGFHISQILIFAIVTYMISAWCSWELGHCYTERIYCDFLCIFALPFASILKYIKLAQSKAFKVLVCIVIIAFISLNIIYMQGVEKEVISINYGTWYSIRNCLFSTLHIRL